MGQVDCLVELPGVFGFPLCNFSLLLCLIIVVVPYDDQESLLESLLKVTNARLNGVSLGAGFVCVLSCIGKGSCLLLFLDIKRVELGSWLALERTTCATSSVSC